LDVAIASVITVLAPLDPDVERHTSVSDAVLR